MALLGTGSAGICSAQAAETHDGFYLRMYLGYGYTTLAVDDLDLSIEGASGAFGIALGGAVADSLIVYGELFDDIATSRRSRSVTSRPTRAAT